MTAARARTLGAAAGLILLFPGCGVPSPRAYTAEPIAGRWRIAILPPVNYTSDSSAPDRVVSVLAAELARARVVDVIDPGVVEEALSREPWLLTDRIPPDLVDKLGEAMGADALLVGAVLAHGYRDEQWGGSVPEFSVSLRLLEIPGGRLRWSANHSRDGADGETLFGFGRVSTLEQLVARTLQEILATLPPVGPGRSDSGSPVHAGETQGETP